MHRPDFSRRRLAGGAFVFGLLAVGIAGCQWSTRSSLPEHIKTVSVPMFDNPTTDYGLETRLTRALRRAVMQDTRLRLVNSGGDAVLSGGIKRIERRSIRDDRDDRPATMQITVHATYSFYDGNARRYLVQDARIGSGEAASARGIYNLDNDPRRMPEEAVLEAAVDALAAEIIRRTLGMW